ncbi:hypothetical protein F0L74_13230 [Chitinophaga agrisoli]|uniref:Uncharacterized protein n=1 Tax=Chitinophaga agrisoli TaxID=2607653 RepID=A0A5B2VYT4_9BACT|nr:hypothetical protein [Chitinophaga agrisoli]KAA2243452.1 hypothetical protein F0L74_13230 [Chitinophaga agrisoli]
MRFVGFIKELDNYPWATPFDNQLAENNAAVELINNIVSYLEKGKLVLGWMGHFVDLQTKEHIAPHAYLSDGIWIWPSYYQYYLKECPNYKLDKDFVNYIREKDFTVELIFNEQALREEFIGKIEAK